MAEFTPAQFALIAKLLQLKEPTRTAARLTLVDGIPVTAAAHQAGVLQPSASRAIKRCRETHQAIRSVYAEGKIPLQT